MGQILSDEGDQEEAVNCLIDDLRWDSKNGWALLMMGNIFARFKKDIPTAMKYYDQALIANPNDPITMNNIGANLMKLGQLEEAKRYFWEALKIKEDYPNAHLALGMIAEKEGDLHSAFYSIIQAIKFGASAQKGVSAPLNTRDDLYQNSVKHAFGIANKITATDDGKKIFREYRHKLEFEGVTEIDLIEDSEIPTAAKIEFAENYNRPKHLIKYKPNYPAVEHLIMHELVHLDLVIEARKTGLNQLFLATHTHKTHFIKSLEPTISKFRKMGLDEASITKYGDGIFNGLNLQVYNAPIDLFIEDFLYTAYPELRPYQLLSLYALLQEGLKAVTDKKIVDLSPKDILSKSKVYNLVNALQFKELFGIDFIKDFRATPAELRLAREFYDEFQEYKEDKKPAEEYELVQHWAQDLRLETLFELVNENEYRTKRLDIDNLLDSIEKDPYDLAFKDPQKEREMATFQKSQGSMGTNMAVVMFMVDALQYFEGRSKDEIKNIAFEIAMLGRQGYSPDKKDYKVGLIPGKLFSGFHMLAYYYISWALAIPDQVDTLELGFEREYEMAKQMANKNSID